MNNGEVFTFIYSPPTATDFNEFLRGSVGFLQKAHVILLHDIGLFKQLFRAFAEGVSYRILIHPGMNETPENRLDYAKVERAMNSLRDLQDFLPKAVPLLTRAQFTRIECDRMNSNYMKRDGYTFFDATRMEAESFVDDIPVFRKGLNAIDMPRSVELTKVVAQEYPQCDYAIITALETDEMEKVLGFIEKVGTVRNKIHLIEYGHLKSNAQKKIVYASQAATGMVDAAILATEILTKFNPKYLIMPGVLGGRPEKTAIGDIVVSKKVFTIDKGKYDDDEFKRELEAVNTSNSAVTKFERHKKEITRFIEDQHQFDPRNVNIHFEPIACVRSVIDQEGFFVNSILSVDRKAIALEMESYGIARACEIINDGQCLPIIIKSVMDNTVDKSDANKSYAAWTSATFLRYVLEKDLI